MRSRDFCFWLQGFFELKDPQAVVSPEQVEIIRKHLALVFKHEIDPSMGDEKMQDLLNHVHNAADGTLYRC